MSGDFEGRMKFVLVSYFMTPVVKRLCSSISLTGSFLLGQGGPIPT